MNEVLLLIKEKIQDIAIVKSCKIGLENAIPPSEYPLIRIVAGRSSTIGYLKAKHQVKIYYGFNLSDFDGIEVVYEKLYSLEKEIKELIVPDMNPYLCKWIDTISDEDRLDGYKVLCSVFEVEEE